MTFRTEFRLDRKHETILEHRKETLYEEYRKNPEMTHEDYIHSLRIAEEALLNRMMQERSRSWPSLVPLGANGQ